jgi:hypothetical protein
MKTGRFTQQRSLNLLDDATLHARCPLDNRGSGAYQSDYQGCVVATKQPTNPGGNPVDFDRFMVSTTTVNAVFFCASLSGSHPGRPNAGNLIGNLLDGFGTTSNDIESH